MKKLSVIFGVFFAISALGLFLCLLGKKNDFGSKIAVLEGQNGQNSALSIVKTLDCQGSCVADALKKEFTQEHARLVKNVQKAFPLEKKAWKNTLNQIDSAINNDNLLTKKPVLKHKKGDHPLVIMARTILASYNINPQRVTIRTINDPTSKTNAATYQGYVGNKVIHELELNIPQLEKHPADIQEAIIRHEINHLLNYDPLKRAYIEVMFLENGLKTEEFMQEPALQELYQFEEYRADLLAACHSIDTARSLQKDFENYMKTYPQDTCACITHPTDEARHQAVTQLMKHLETENKLKLA